MKKSFSLVVLLALAFLSSGLLMGFLAHKHHLYPQNLTKRLFHRFSDQPLDSQTTWSIGVYKGTSPSAFQECAGITNPVLTAENVTDITATFVADPFIIAANHEFHMFFEVFNTKTGQGDIGHAVSADAMRWKYDAIVLNEDFHLSYPYVFEWNNEYYMIPESCADLSVRLYKASNFPSEWKLEKTLLSGYRYVDPSIARHAGKWWLFLTTPESDHLNVYSSEDLMGEWKPHPMNPVVKNNKKHSRPGGRILTHKGRLIRYAQDDEPEYGLRLRGFEITRLTDSAYAEKPLSREPILGPSGSPGWNGSGMHHLDSINMGDHWIGVVDGRR